MQDSRTPLSSIIRFCLENKLVVSLFVLFVVVWGVMVAPFDWETELLPRDPVPVDAIPDIGENQQIVFTKWPGRSPQDVEDQITYPMTVALLGIPGVKTVRSYSYFGYSSIYVIFKEEFDFYWSRSRILEKLSSLPPGTLPPEVSPALGPDATALGQVYWYTIEGRDKDGNPTGGWDLDEIRSTQDWYVRYALQGVEGISEVASIGGFVKEYQIDVDPNAMRAYGVKLSEVIDAVRASNIDVGARTIEVNNVEYVIRGLGFIRAVSDLENTAVKASKDSKIPVHIKNIATVGLGPALRRGALDKDGAEVVGGVAVVRYGENPLSTIKRLKERIQEISPGLPEKTLSDGTVSKLTIVPFYDRTGLIYETLGTLNSALTEEILVTIIVVIVMVMHLGSSLLVSGLLPLSVLICFIFMKLFGVDANIVALSGIAIAIGTMVDMGVVLCENILSHLKSSPEGKSRLETIYEASVEVGGAVVTAVLTTVVSFLPVFAMEAAEGKLFRPLAYTKTFALISAIIVAIAIIPPAAHVLLRNGENKSRLVKLLYWLEILAGLVLVKWFSLVGFALLALGVFGLNRERISLLVQNYFPKPQPFMQLVPATIILLTVLFILTGSWMPFGVETSFLVNVFFTGLVIAAVLYLFKLFERSYSTILMWCLTHKGLFLIAPATLLVAGFLSWRSMGKEFMPPLDEGSFLYMPTTMPHASIGEALDQLKKLDMAVSSIPEVSMTVGKLGRADSALDPAPISMYENIVNYKPEYAVDKDGRVLRFEYHSTKGDFKRDSEGNLIPDSNGKPFRQWRDHIRNPDDIWREIVQKAKIPGITSAPKLQPIAARLVMLQSGMRAPMGVKIKGPTLETIEEAGLKIERALKEVAVIDSDTVIADRIVGKPYLQIHINREQIARYGLSIRAVQSVIEVAIGGIPLTVTVEGRERYPVRIRYPRELRDNLEDLTKILIPTPTGQQIPLGELATIEFMRQAQVIKSEDTFLTGYVVFDMTSGNAEVEVVEAAKTHLENKISDGSLSLPPNVSYTFAGSYENQLRSEKKLAVVLPLALFVIFIIIYLQFRSTVVTLLIFSGVFIAWSGGFIMLWLYGQDWFFNLSLFGTNLRDLFQMREYNLSVAVWVGFLALFGIATDDGVLISTYIKQSFARNKPKSREEVRQAILEAGERRIRPALMTTATTLLALLPVLTSRGRGADIMVPMAIPSFGGMAIALITVLVVPVLYCAIEERRVLKNL
ncbi:MAG: efflux RND transporter permease subunit [Bdellovibrionales bacterium]|nr:efflux RND transporter permease subunit [Bdellovibrionales bacterium]